MGARTKQRTTTHRCTVTKAPNTPAAATCTATAPAPSKPKTPPVLKLPLAKPAQPPTRVDARLIKILQRGQNGPATPGRPQQPATVQLRTATRRPNSADTPTPRAPHARTRTPAHDSKGRRITRVRRPRVTVKVKRLPPPNPKPPRVIKPPALPGRPMPRKIRP